MPTAPLRACLEPRCPALVPSGRCAAHQRKRYQQQDANRGTSTDRGYGQGWQPLRVTAFVRDMWRCVQCGWEPELVSAFREAGLGLPSTAALLDILRDRFKRGQKHLHADHILTIEERPELSRELGNIQTLCSVCHGRKTMRDSVTAKS